MMVIDSKSVDPVVYQLMVRSMLYIAIGTRHDISQAVGVVAKYNAQPSEVHLWNNQDILTP